MKTKMKIVGEVETEEAREVEKRDYIKPDSLAAFLKTCTDNELCGRICRAVAGQDVRTNTTEDALVKLILTDLESYGDRCKRIREGCRIRKARWRKRIEEEADREFDRRRKAGKEDEE